MYPASLTRMRHADRVQQRQSCSIPTADATRRAGVMNREDIIAAVKDHEDAQHSTSLAEETAAYPAFPDATGEEDSWLEEEDDQRYPEPPSRWPQAWVGPPTEPSAASSASQEASNAEAHAKQLMEMLKADPMMLAHFKSLAGLEDLP